MGADGKMYWETSLDNFAQTILDSIPRKTFERILRNLNICDNKQLDKQLDKFSKIRPLINELNKRSLKFFFHGEKKPIDESMISFCGTRR